MWSSKLGTLGHKVSREIRRYRVLLWCVICATLLGYIAVVVVGLREMLHEFDRVAPEESAANAWLTEKGACVEKEGKDRHIISVRLDGKDVSDSEIVRLMDLTHLQYLDLSGTQITDAGLQVLLPLKELKYVDVSNTRVTADGYTAFLEKQRSVWEGIEEW